MVAYCVTKKEAQYAALFYGRLRTDGSYSIMGSGEHKAHFDNTEYSRFANQPEEVLGNRSAGDMNFESIFAIIILVYIMKGVFSHAELGGR